MLSASLWMEKISEWTESSFRGISNSDCNNRKLRTTICRLGLNYWILWQLHDVPSWLLYCTYRLKNIRSYYIILELPSAILTTSSIGVLKFSRDKKLSCLNNTSGRIQCDYLCCELNWQPEEQWRSLISVCLVKLGTASERAVSRI